MATITKELSPGTKQRVHTSASVLLKINNHVIGVGQNATGTENFNIIAVPKGFGSTMPLEHVPTEWSGSVSIDKFYIRTRSLVDLGLAPTGEGVVSMPPIDIEFVDVSNPDSYLTKFIGCTIQTREFTVSHNAIVGERATWLALDAQNPNAKATIDDKLYADTQGNLPNTNL